VEFFFPQKIMLVIEYDSKELEKWVREILEKKVKSNF
jgi:hypothetical protein